MNILEIANTTISELNTVDDSTNALEDSTKENNSINENATISSSQSNETKSQPTSNAFEFMMTARYKSIGTNSPGKELPNKEIKTSLTDRETNVKRKLMLEEWADRKGRAKKRLNEAADDEYIDMVMEKRAKRLRTLLKNGERSKEIENVKEEAVPTKKSNRLKLKITKGKNRIEDSEDEDVGENHKSSTKSSNRSVNGRRKGTNSAEDETFVEHLSSPLKKRDSLLGYFSKLTKTPSVDGSPHVTAPENISVNVTDSIKSNKRGKKRGRNPKTATNVDSLSTQSTSGDYGQQVISKEESDEILVVDDSIATPSLPSSSDSTKPLSEGRPKRLCREKKISYLIDEDFAPYRSRVKKPVDNDYISPKETPKQSKITEKHSKATKLAPIFAKATPKPLVDPTVLRARHEFLMSGIPEKMKLEIEKQRQFEEIYETEFEVFPKISHVGHWTEPSNVVMDFSKMNIRFRPDDSDEEFVTNSVHANRILKIRKSFSQKDSESREKTMDQKELMRKLKHDDESDFPYYRCFKQLKRKTTTDHVDENVDGDNSIELVVDKVASINGNELFTEKYRPLTSSEVLLNTKPLIELQKFLSSWKENMDGRECSDSSDDFNTNSNSGMSSMNKAIVLSGPPGCGKTSFVYALANEMNFKVLEINAGARRTGKKVLKKLQEATQSHHVNNNQCSQNDRTKNVKSKQWEDSEESSASQKLSLILIEDAEVVFEEDFGFVESINQLVTTTKRPVILITNQMNCSHLSRFISRNTILFRMPKLTIASKWLSTLSVAEQCYVSEDMCRALYQRNNCDFRKTLLELQFFIQSTNRMQDSNAKSVVCSSASLCDLFFKNQNQPNRIVPFPIDFTNLTKSGILNERNVEENGVSETGKLNSNSLNETLDFLDIISTAQWLEQKTDSSDRIVNHLSDDISHFMVEQSIKIRSENLSNYESTTIESNSMTR